jgi:Arc/MetJ family transcription regulator
MAATDFFPVEVWTPRGLVIYYGSVRHATQDAFRAHHRGNHGAQRAYMKQVARNLINVSDGFLANSRYLIMDCDTKYTEDFRGHLDREGVKPVLCPVRVPNCKAQNDLCVPFGEASLRRALRETVADYHTERNHQGVGNRLLEPLATVSSTNDPMDCRERLGGMPNFYYHEAA